MVHPCRHPQVISLLSSLIAYTSRSRIWIQVPIAEDEGFTRRMRVREVGERRGGEGNVCVRGRSGEAAGWTNSRTSIIPSPLQSTTDSFTRQLAPQNPPSSSRRYIEFQPRTAASRISKFSTSSLASTTNALFRSTMRTVSWRCVYEATSGPRSDLFGGPLEYEGDVLCGFDGRSLI